MGFFSRGKSGGIMNVIRCDEQDYIVWKWRPLKAASPAVAFILLTPLWSQLT